MYIYAQFSAPGVPSNMLNIIPPTCFCPFPFPPASPPPPPPGKIKRVAESNSEKPHLSAVPVQSVSRAFEPKNKF